MSNKKMFVVSILSIICSFVIAFMCCFMTLSSSKAFQIGNSDITSNEGQVLSSLDNNNDIYNMTINSVTTSDNLTYYSMYYYLVRTNNSSNINTRYNFVVNACQFDSISSSFTCPSISRYDLTTGATNNIVGYNNIVVNLYQSEVSDINGIYPWRLKFSSLPLVYGDSTISTSNLIFQSDNKTFSDGVQLGIKMEKVTTYNTLYYRACIINRPSTNDGSQFYCNSSRYSINNLPSESDFLSELLSFYSVESGSTILDLYNWLRSEYTNSYNSCMATSNNSSCTTWTNNALTLSNLQTGVNTLVANKLLTDYSLEYQPIYDLGYNTGKSEGYDLGYTTGYNGGFLEGQEREDVLGNAVISVASVPLTVLSGMLSFDILGFNVLGLVLGLFTLLLIIWVIKKVFK